MSEQTTIEKTLGFADEWRKRNGHERENIRKLLGGDMSVSELQLETERHIIHVVDTLNALQILMNAGADDESISAFELEDLAQEIRDTYPEVLVNA